MKRLLPYTLLLLLAACGSALKREGTVGNWQVMVANPGKSDMLCYAGASPVSSEGTANKREGAPYLMVTRRASGKIEISASAGYAFMKGSKAELAVDDDSYGLFYKGAVAWARNDEEDKTIIESIKEAEAIEVRGVSQGGLTSVDRYSPQGFAAAVARIRKLCP